MCLTKADYFIGFFLPTIISVLLTIPIRMIDLNAKQFQPFHNLTRTHGASAYSSLCLQTGGLYGIAASIRSLFGGQALVFLTSLLTLCSVFLVPISSEAVSLQLHGSCAVNDFRGCAMTLSVFLVPARVTMALLATMILLLLLILLILRQWSSGVATNPWSIAGIAALSTNSDVRALIASIPPSLDGRVRQARLMKALDGFTFKLGYFSNMSDEVEYGIQVHSETSWARNEHDCLLNAHSVKEQGALGPSALPPGRERRAGLLPFVTLSYWGRISFLVFLTTLMVIILYYNLTFDDTPFERFMDTQNFGVRFVFTMAGIGITFFWTSFFSSESLCLAYQGQHMQCAADRLTIVSQAWHSSARITCFRRGRSMRIARSCCRRPSTPSQASGARYAGATDPS